jgi:hypothetical protein
MYTFTERKKVTWFLTYLPTSKEWLMYAENNGIVIPQTKEFRKRLNKEIRETFNIK